MTENVISLNNVKKWSQIYHVYGANRIFNTDQTKSNGFRYSIIMYRQEMYVYSISHYYSYTKVLKQGDADKYERITFNISPYYMTKCDISTTHYVKKKINIDLYNIFKEIN